ncbi:M16 family metallopeptidase [Aridibaculum aurantiacum]|uniref:M16 family metallopeptidase n=1 Tax=Aridibaculum aurantiacum TaxID=2810307 RepID=UPI001A9752A6|nr:pitrilysin family protein [Aridibaculum aurantiacum]
MKKSIILLFTLLPFSMMAQVDRSKAPAPAPAPEIKVGKPATFTLPNGLRVFVVSNNKLPRVSATLTMDMDGIVEGDKAGLTDLAGSLLRRGTTKMPKAKLDEEIDFLGANVNTSAWGVSASSLKSNFPKVMSLVGDIVLRPALPAAELEKLRKQSISGLQAAKDNPDAIAANVVNRLAYGKNHPYGDIETEETINNVKHADIKQFFNTYWKPNNAYLVFVGDISVTEARALALSTFGAWAKGNVPKKTYTAPQAPAKTYIAVVDRPSSVQSVINFITPVPLKPGTADVIPASVMNNILGAGSSSRLFMNLREKHGFTYGAYSNLKSDRLVGSFTASASVRNEKTDSAIGQFLHEFERIRTEPLSDTSVQNMKNNLAGSFARSLESPSTIANFALNTARYNLPETYYQDYLKNLAAVTPQSAQAVAKKYVTPNQMHIVIVGNAKEIAPGLEKYGEVKYFDVYGNPMAAPVVKEVGAGVTAESIIQKAITAAGGAAAISALKDVQLNGTVSVMGQSLNLSQKHVFPTAFTLELGMQGMVLQKKAMNNGQYTLTAQGQTQQPEEKDKEEINEDAALISEVYLAKQPGYKFTLAGIEQVNGKDAYVVKVNSPAGREYSNYYDVNSGLKIQQTREEDAGPMGKITVSTSYSDFKPYAGVQIPTKMVVNQGPVKLDISFNDIKVNSGLQADQVK